MKNTKMKYKIFFVIMLLLTLLNNASAVTYENGTLEKSIIATQHHTNTLTAVNLKDFTEQASWGYDWMVDDIGQAGIPSIYHTSNLHVGYTGNWTLIPSSVGAPIYLGEQGINGTGSLYFFKTSTPGMVQLKIYFDDNYNCDVGTHNIYIYADILDNYYTGMYATSNPGEATAIQNDLGCAFVYAETQIFGRNTADTSTTSYYSSGLFINDYSIKMDYSFGIANITRVIPEATLTSSSFIFKNETGYEIYNSGYTSSNGIYNYANESGNYYLKVETNQQEYLIYSNIPEAPPEDTTPTLTTDKTNYNTSELLTISYTNINEMDIYGVPSLFIVYPVIDDYHDYDTKFMQHLLSSKEDETFTINTSILQPQNEYYLVITDNTDWSRVESAYITSDVFYVYTDDEYLTTSCTSEGNCYTYNDASFEIYYKITNNSNIIIKDDEGNIIQTYYNIINEGVINYNIPIDENKINTYPNWKIYLNNTEYDTNYSTDVIVYWSLITSPTPTPIYTSVPIDENVSEQIEGLKEESKPIFDLIYGLSELVIDNPDYDDDNIITENEMNNWFNSLIPIVLILLIFIVYTGLTKKR